LLGDRHDPVPHRRQHPAFGGAFEKLRAQLVLQTMQAARHGGVGDAEAPRRAANRAGSRGGQKNPDIVPIEHMDRFRSNALRIWIILYPTELRHQPFIA
jgi:hypothetical protein